MSEMNSNHGHVHSSENDASGYLPHIIAVIKADGGKAWRYPGAIGFFK
jgi:hypothetical protein